ncbi:MAG: hypothetical protein WBN20_08730 [Eudoraea sp.]
MKTNQKEICPLFKLNINQLEAKNQLLLHHDPAHSDTERSHMFDKFM